MRICAHCGKEIDSQLEIMRSSSCLECGADLKTCTNCTFYSPGAHWDCHETISEPVREKGRSNFCDFFRFKDSAPGKAKGGAGDKAKDDFFKLFGAE
jgi:hypothetical protein